jgi:hypothetical protein
MSEMGKQKRSIFEPYPRFLEAEEALRYFAEVFNNNK